VILCVQPYSGMLILIGPTNDLYSFHDHRTKVSLPLKVNNLLLLDDIGEYPLSALGTHLILALVIVMDFRKASPTSLIGAVMEALMNFYSLEAIQFVYLTIHDDVHVGHELGDLMHNGCHHVV
jgi:hypothetical protein